MHLKLNFKKMKTSRELTDYIEHRFEKLRKYEMKPVNCTVTLCVEKDTKVVEIHAVGEQKTFHSQGISLNFFESIDLAVDRMARQMMKKKAKVQNHKCYERSHHGKMDQLNDALEFGAPADAGEGKEVA